MKETILLFQPPEKSDLAKIRRALLPLKIRFRIIPKVDFKKPIGASAGLEIPETPEIDSKNIDLEENASLPAPLFVFAFLSDSHLNQVLQALRRCGAGPFPYKAVLTPTNQSWNAYECFDEVKKEHERMSAGTKQP